MNNVSKTKVAIGYALLLIALILSLLFVRREMTTLMNTGEQDVEWADSLLELVREKDSNTIDLLRLVSEANRNVISANELEQLLASHDTIRLPRKVQRRITTQSDTVIQQTERKSFFRRLGEVFNPPEQDTAIHIITTTELTTDTIVARDDRFDSLQQHLRAVAQKQEQANAAAQRYRKNLQRINSRLTARIDTLVKQYETNTLTEAHEQAQKQEAVRLRSARMIGATAIAALLLAATFLAIIGRDITRSNRYRHQLEEARKRAEDLLATREKMMLTITHDFKAPLGSIMGYADLLSRLTVDERQRFYLQSMKTSSQHLLKLVVELLQFHRLDLNKAEVTEVVFVPSQLIEETCISFEPMAAAKGLKLRRDIAPALQNNFTCDPLHLRQIIDNLLSNAVKFTEHGNITLTARYENGKLLLQVSDTGKGMAPADRERIFHDFTRLPEAQGKEGFGLGLSIVRRLIALLQGDISVQSTPGKGSTFTVHIPMRIAPVSKTPAQQGNADTTPLHTELRNIRVLLIDDDRIQLQLTTAMLNQSGISSTACLQVDELLEALRTEHYTTVLTDVQMPAINGFDLVQLLRASNIPQARTIPIIAVTARSDMQRADFIKHGFAGCLFKPFTTTELLTEIGANAHSSKKESETNSDTQEAGNLYNFSALTTFAGNDKAAAQAILDNFITETKLNVARMQQALSERNITEIASIAHKMIPLFKLTGPDRLVQLLGTLELAGRQQTDNRQNLQSDIPGPQDKLKDIVDDATECIQDIVNAAENLL